ncbi:hypothetical protein FSP39_000848 [Pinctada imbricata]|uniref:[Histone H3]-lysine(4) N-trimethyltransferase n=1 Tax=Pinctada imbricata TaxID=66713 RepID=A0AA88YC20_PINIB|nr:hypothetical protein FSP39_000848 [Pinctada imbricata]
METQAGAVLDRTADTSSKMTTPTAEIALDRDSETSQQPIDLHLPERIVKNENAKQEAAIGANKSTPIENGKDNEKESKEKEKPILDSVSQTIHDVATGVLAPDPCSTLLDEFGNFKSSTKYGSHKSNQNSRQDHQNNVPHNSGHIPMSHSRLQSNLQPLPSLSHGGFMNTKNDPHYQNRVSMPNQNIHPQQFSHARPHHQSMGSASLQHDELRKQSSGDLHHFLPHQGITSSTNSSLGQNQISGATDDFQSSNTAGHYVPPMSTSVRPPGQDHAKPKGGGRRAPRQNHNQDQTQGGMPYMMQNDKFAARRMLDPRLVQHMQQMVRMNQNDPRFVPDPRMIPPQLLQFMRMQQQQQLSKQQMGAQSQQQPPQAHVSQPQIHSDVAHYQGMPPQAHGAPIQHVEIPGQFQRMPAPYQTRPPSQPSEMQGAMGSQQYDHTMAPAVSTSGSTNSQHSQLSQINRPPSGKNLPAEQPKTDSFKTSSNYSDLDSAAKINETINSVIAQSAASQPESANDVNNDSASQIKMPPVTNLQNVNTQNVPELTVTSAVTSASTGVPEHSTVTLASEHHPSSNMSSVKQSVPGLASQSETQISQPTSTHQSNAPTSQDSAMQPKSSNTPSSSVATGNSAEISSAGSSTTASSTDGVVTLSSVPSSQQSVQMSTCTTQTPYEEDNESKKTPSQGKLVPALSQSHSQSTRSQPVVATSAPVSTGSHPRMTPPHGGAAMPGMPPQGLPLVKTPLGMLPHYPPGISQASGMPPYGGMRPFPVPHSQMPQMPPGIPPGIPMPPNMRMPGFPPGFPIPPRMPGMGSMQSAMASMAQQVSAEMAVSSNDQGSTPNRLASPVSSAAGPRLPQPTSVSASQQQQLENLYRASMMRAQGPQQHQMRMPPGARLPAQGPPGQHHRMPGQLMPGMRMPMPTSDSPRLMSPTQQGKEPHFPPPGAPLQDPTKITLGHPALPSPAASSTPSPKITTPTPPLNKMDQSGGFDPVAMTELISRTEVKQEIDDGAFKPDMTQEEQNALLKRLLKTSAPGVHRQMSAVSEDSEDAPSLTPEQQKQLELIEKMPLVTETEWDQKTPEEKDHLIEMKKQAYEQKRKEFEMLRKLKRKQQGQGEPRKRKKKEKPAEGEGQIPGMPGEQPGQPSPPKKRQRKKKQVQNMMEEDLEAKAEFFLQTLRTLPTVALQEPKVGNFFNVSPIPGSPAAVTGDNSLKGSFGKSYLEGVADFYGNTLLRGLPPLGSFVSLPRPQDESRRKSLGLGQEDSAPDSQRYPLASDQSSAAKSRLQSQSGPSHSFPAPLIGMGDKPVMPVLPPSPRIEPRLDPVLRGDDSPCTIVSSSSPEHEFGDGNEDDYPMLKPIDPPHSSNDDRSSPAVPVCQPVPVRLDSLKIKEEDTEDYGKENADRSTKSVSKELEDMKMKKLDSSLMDKENVKSKISLTQPFRDANLNQDISVTLTLSTTAAEDIGGVLSQIADLLKIAVPPSYEISRSPSPEMFKMNMKHKEEPVNIHSLIKSKAKFCRHCDMVVFDSGYRKKRSEIPFLVKDDYSFKDFDDDEVTFCSEKCYSAFASIYQMIHKPPPEDLSISNKTFAHALGAQKPTTIYNLLSPKNNDPLLPTTPTKSDLSLTPTPSTPTSAGTITPVHPSPPIRQKSDEKQLKKHKRSSSDAQAKPLTKKWKDVRYKKWDPSFTNSLGMAPGVPESEVETLWKALGTVIVPNPRPEDDRRCAFCQGKGDGDSDGPGRLLNMDVNKWAHLNCALWSSEVYETLNGALMNVDGAYKRGQTIDCALCKTKGATVGCFNMRCPKYYHLGCAKRAGCMFFQDKTILCPAHAPKQEAENVLESLVVYRRVYINRNEDQQVANMVHGQEDGNHLLRVGSLILHNVGQLLPHQIQTGKFHTRDYIYPVGFKSSRLYWSMRRLYKRCRYNCKITEKEGRPWFIITVVEPGCEDVTFQDSSPRAVWNKILEPLDKLRRAADLVKIFPNFITGEELFGLTEPSVVRVIESLPGTDLFTNYSFKFSRSLRIEMPLTINPTGCARTEPKLRTHFRKPHTLQSSNTSHSLPSTVTGITGDINSPYMKQFVHSKSQQYRRLKTEWRNNVYLGRSRIQGLGLYAARDLEKHTMVIEYIGYLIRNEVANRKEIIYEEQNRGVYMFRIDKETVVDATMAGGPARYINHSCNPNCVAEVVPFDKESKIIIITNRRIPRGEELTYDYKFDFEDDQHKIPCCCGAPKCRKWMN